MAGLATGIEGVKFLDLDADGVFGPGDSAPIVPVEIRAYVDSDGNGKLSQAEFDAGFAASDLTDAGTGAYFLDVEGGAEYIVVEVIDSSSFAQVPLGQSVLDAGLNTGNTIGAFGYSADMTYAGTVFAVNRGDSTFNGTIFEIDTTDGQVVADPESVWDTEPNSLSGSAPNGLAFDLETNTLYYSTLGRANPAPGSEYAVNAQLWKVDLATNVPSFVATLEGSVAGASFRDGAYLYVAQNTGDLYSYDVAGDTLSLLVDLNMLPLPNYDPTTRFYFGDVAVKRNVLYGMGTLDPSQPLNGATDEAFLWSYDLETSAFLDVSSYAPNPLVSGIAFGGDGELYAHFYGDSFVINQIPLNGDPAVPLGPALDKTKYAINDMASNLVLSGRDFANYPRGDEGLSHGFWKTHTTEWAATGFAKTDLVKNAFGLTNAELAAVGISSTTTLQQALNFGGGSGVAGGARNLLKQAVASLLNAAHPGVNFYYLVSEVKSLTVAAIQSANRNTMLALAAIFDDLNNGIHPF